jgi:hypothetical protein
MDLRLSANEFNRGHSRAVWVDWTPSYGSSGGPTPTVTTNVAKYWTFGKLLYFNLDVTIDVTNGATGLLYASLPFSPSPALNSMIIGQGRDGVINSMLLARWVTSASRLAVGNHDGNSVIIVGRRPTIGGVYRVA